MIPDAVPLDREIRDPAWELTNGWVGGVSKIHAEDIKLWLCGITSEEDPKKGLNNIGEGDNWCLLVSLIQAVWLQSEIPQQLTWVIVVLLLKGGETNAVLAFWSQFGRWWSISWIGD
jgi:hypothetical protein